MNALPTPIVNHCLGWIPFGPPAVSLSSLGPPLSWLWPLPHVQALLGMCFIWFLPSKSKDKERNTHVKTILSHYSHYDHIWPHKNSATWYSHIASHSIYGHSSITHVKIPIFNQSNEVRSSKSPTASSSMTHCSASDFSELTFFASQFVTRIFSQLLLQKRSKIAVSKRITFRNLHTLR